MKNNEELQQKIQEETYKIICESITTEECQEMNLMSEEIIPTINFFKQVQTTLVDKSTQNKLPEVEYIYQDFDFKSYKFYIVPELLHVNRNFLSRLCHNSGIEFYTFEDRYHFELTKTKINEDIKKKNHI